MELEIQVMILSSFDTHCADLVRTLDLLVVDLGVVPSIYPKDLFLLKHSNLEFPREINFPTKFHRQNVRFIGHSQIHNSLGIKFRQKEQSATLVFNKTAQQLQEKRVLDDPKLWEKIQI